MSESVPEVTEKIPFDWIKQYKQSDAHKEFLAYLEQFDWDEMARQHHGDLPKWK